MVPFKLIRIAFVGFFLLFAVLIGRDVEANPLLWKSVTLSEFTQLNQMKIPDNLNKLFKEKDKTLTNSASVDVSEKDQLWQILDINETYVLRKEGKNTVKVYQGILPKIEDKLLRIRGGMISLNPFSIEKMTDDMMNEIFVINNSDNSSKPFLELSYINRWAWNEVKESKLTDSGTMFSNWKEIKKSKDWGQLFMPFVPDDYVIRFGFVFDGEDDTSASAVVGSGDVFTTNSIGWHLYWNKQLNRTFNLDVILGGVTERGINDIHDREGIGLSYLKKTELAKLMLRLSYNRIETPKIDPNSPNQLHVLAKNGNPEFEGEDAYGFEVEFESKPARNPQTILPLADNFI